MKKITCLLYLLLAPVLAQNDDYASLTPRHMRKALRRKRDVLLVNFAEIQSQLRHEHVHESADDHADYYENTDYPASVPSASAEMILSADGTAVLHEPTGPSAEQTASSAEHLDPSADETAVSDEAPSGTVPAAEERAVADVAPSADQAPPSAEQPAPAADETAVSDEPTLKDLDPAADEMAVSDAPTPPSAGEAAPSAEQTDPAANENKDAPALASSVSAEQTAPSAEEAAFSAEQTALAVDQTAAATNSVMTVGLLVPCLQKNIDSCEIHRMLDSVAAQTELPDKVMIVPSGMSAADGEKLQKDLTLLYADTPLKNTKFEVTALPKQVYAGEARNHGIEKLDTKVVIAMDADDEMAPIYVAVAKSVLKETGSRCMLHTFAWPKDRKVAFETRDSSVWRKAVQADGVSVYKMCAALPKNNGTVKIESGGLGWSNKGKEVAEGHLTCQREVFEKIKYNTDMEKGEDSVLLRKILTHYGANDALSLHVVDVVLSVYHPSNTPRNEWMRSDKFRARVFGDEPTDGAVAGWTMLAKAPNASQSSMSGCVRDEKTKLADRV